MTTLSISNDRSFRLGAIVEIPDMISAAIQTPGEYLQAVSGCYSIIVGLWLLIHGSMNASVFAQLVMLARPFDANLLYGWMWLFLGLTGTAALLLRFRLARVGSQMILASLWSLTMVEVLVVRGSAFIPSLFACNALLSILTMWMTILEEAPKGSRRFGDDDK